MRGVGAVVSILAVIVSLAPGRVAAADDCAQHARSHPQSYVGIARTDPDDPSIPDADWIALLPFAWFGENRYPGGPIFDGDSTANDDAKLLDRRLSDGTTEYDSLGWRHPVNWALGGDQASSVLYRLYAMEQGLDLTGASAPLTLSYSGVDQIAGIVAPFIVLHVGTNSLNTAEPEEDIVAGIEALVCVLKRDMPLVPRIVVVSIYPRGRWFGNQVARRRFVNGALAAAAARHQFPFLFVDTTDYLTRICAGKFDAKGQCFYFKDLVHPVRAPDYTIDRLIRDALAKAG